MLDLSSNYDDPPLHNLEVKYIILQNTHIQRFLLLSPHFIQNHSMMNMLNMHHVAIFNKKFNQVQIWHSQFVQDYPNKQLQLITFSNIPPPLDLIVHCFPFR